MRDPARARRWVAAALVVAISSPALASAGEPSTAASAGTSADSLAAFPSDHQNPDLNSCYYYRGRYYPYHYHGHYYHYRYRGRYCNHRYYRNGGWYC